MVWVLLSLMVVYTLPARGGNTRRACGAGGGVSALRGGGGGRMEDMIAMDIRSPPVHGSRIRSLLGNQGWLATNQTVVEGSEETGIVCCVCSGEEGAWDALCEECDSTGGCE